MKSCSTVNIHKMDVTTVCLMLATLRVTPDRSQFFENKGFVMKCEVSDGCSSWKVKRNTSRQVSESCENGWGTPGSSSCTTDFPKKSDGGVYWCESTDRRKSNSINITIAVGYVILSSPAFPVTEGEAVTLLCLDKEHLDSHLPTHLEAKFFKDDVFIGTEPAGKMVLPAVSFSDEGFYSCELPTKGKSRKSWLAVRARPLDLSTHLPVTCPPRSSPPALLPALLPVSKLVFFILLFVFYIIILSFCIYTYSSARAKAKMRDPERPVGGECEEKFLQTSQPIKREEKTTD